MVAVGSSVLGDRDGLAHVAIAGWASATPGQARLRRQR
jgi:hypothetical protein